VKYYAFFIIIIITFIGCNQPTSLDKEYVLSTKYTSLIQELNLNDFKLTKYIIKGEKTDTVFVDSVNWEKELKLFLESDISKSNSSLYKITTVNDGCEKTLQTTDFKQNVKKLQFDSCNGGLHVNINVEKKNMLYEFKYHLELNENGFLIECNQDVEFAFESSYRIEGKFTK
jgi:hypothetical protein